MTSWHWSIRSYAASMASVFGMLKRSFSGENKDSSPTKSELAGTRDTLESATDLTSPQSPKAQQRHKSRKGKRYRSGDSYQVVADRENLSKKKKLQRMDNTSSRPSLLSNGDDEDYLSSDTTESDSGDEEDQSAVDLSHSKVKIPDETPEWGTKLFEFIEMKFEGVNQKINHIERSSKKNSSSVKKMTKKLESVELRNKALVAENLDLKEHLLEVEYRQRRSNLIFEGITDNLDETDLDCIRKLRHALSNIPGLDAENFRIDRCHRLDGKFKLTKSRRLICCFNWYYDVQCILKNKKAASWCICI